jgi:hypothetical protein
MEKLNLEELVGKFIGESKILSAREVDEKTFLGVDKIEVTLDGGVKKLLPVDMVNCTTSIVAVDFTQQVEKRLGYVLPKLIGIFTDSELTKDEISYLLNGRIQNLVAELYSEAVDKLFGKKQYDVTLQEIDNILKK